MNIFAEFQRDFYVYCCFVGLMPRDSGVTLGTYKRLTNRV